MPHCYSIQATLQGGQYTLCATHVPGNEALAQEIEQAGLEGRAPRSITREEVARAVRFFEEQDRRSHERQGPLFWGHEGEQG